MHLTVPRLALLQDRTSGSVSVDKAFDRDTIFAPAYQT